MSMADVEERRKRDRERKRAWRLADPEGARAYEQAVSRRWREKHPGKVAMARVRRKAAYRASKTMRDGLKEQARQWHADNRERSKANKRGWLERNRCHVKESARRRRLLREWGLTAEQYAFVLMTQDGHCAICPSDVSLVVDHDHASGRIRSILCNRCNKAIGLLEDNHELVAAAAEYLQRHSTTTVIPAQAIAPPATEMVF